MYSIMNNRTGGTSIQASRGFRGMRGKGGHLGMLTVYGYGFEESKPEEPPTPWLTYTALAAAGWWAWRKWGRKAATA